MKHANNSVLISVFYQMLELRITTFYRLCSRSISVFIAKSDRLFIKHKFVMEFPKHYSFIALSYQVDLMLKKLQLSLITLLKILRTAFDGCEYTTEMCPETQS